MVLSYFKSGVRAEVHVEVGGWPMGLIGKGNKIEMGFLADAVGSITFSVFANKSIE